MEKKLNSVTIYSVVTLSLLSTVFLVLRCSQEPYPDGDAIEGSSSNSNQQPLNSSYSDADIKTANALLELLGTSVNTEYTAEQMEQDAKSWTQIVNKRRRQLGLLNEAEIIKETDASEEEFRKACSQYRTKPYGALPTTRQRIQELAEQYDKRLANQRELVRKRRALRIPQLPPIGTPEELQELADRLKVSKKELRKAYTYFSIKPYGELPTTLERIQKLAKNYDAKAAEHREYQRNKRARSAGKAAVRAASSKTAPT